MSTATLTQTDRELLELIRSTDEMGKEIIFEVLVCVVSFGDPFLEAFGAAIKLGWVETEKTLNEWKARVIQ